MPILDSWIVVSLAIELILVNADFSLFQGRDSQQKFSKLIYGGEINSL